MPIINFLSILFFIFYLNVCVVYLLISICSMRCLFYLCYYNSLFSNLEPPRYPMLEEEDDKDHRARYIEVGQVTKFVIFFTLTLVRKVCKTNKHCFMSLVGSFDPPSQGPRWGHSDGFLRAICAPTSPGQPVGYRRDRSSWHAGVQRHGHHGDGG
jgi:hypothetical protein